MLELAENRDSVAGVVGWLDVTRSAEELAGAWADLRRRFTKLSAIRPVANYAEPDGAWLIREDVTRGLATLATLNVPLDLSLRPFHLRSVHRLSEKLPNLDIVIDHLAKPFIKDAVLEPWRTDLKIAAENPRIYCKLSGMETEADIHNWKWQDFLPYVAVVLEYFGLERVMFGSNWPVCTLAASYVQVVDSLRSCLKQFVGSDYARIEPLVFHANAARFYSLKTDSGVRRSAV
jgi:L-fuconolactonase